MAIIKSFRAVRPATNSVEQVASVPYDVVDRDECRQLAEGKPNTFLRVVRSDLEFPDEVDAYADEIYQRAKDNLARLISEGQLIQDEIPGVYIYQVQMGEQIQTGVVALSSVDEYDNNLVKKHEKTRPVKENDRTRHIIETKAHTGPVFLTYKAVDAISKLIAKETEESPLYNFTAEDGIRHAVWQCKDSAAVISAFEKVPCTYVADGHHRAASASRCRAELKAKNPNHKGDEAYNFFLSVLFPDEELKILPYNRIVKSLNGHSEAEVLAKLEEVYQVTPNASAEPKAKGHVSMYLSGKWYGLAPKAGEQLPSDPVESLEVSILANKVLKPIFNIQDERTDANIDFIGGIRGTKHLEDLVNSKKAVCAFSVYATSIEELMTIADNDQIMAPKSTWFEPKLRSGLLIHKFN